MHPSTLRLALVAPAALALASCVLTPSWGDSPSSRRDPIDLSGMASRTGAPLRIQAFNHTTGAFDTIRAFTGTANQWASDPDLFGWNTIGVTLPDRYWSGGGCESSGMANLRVQEINSDGTTMDLATFDAAGRACVNEHLADGEHAVVAGNACKLPDETIVLFTPPQCVFPRTVDATPPTATIRLTDGRRAWQVGSGSGAADVTATGISRTALLTATAMLRDPDGAIASAHLLGDVNVVCRRTSDGSSQLVPGAVNVLRTQTLTTTVRAQISLDAARLVDVNRLVTATCPAGTTFLRATGLLFATGSNAAGATATSPAIHFTI